MKSIIFGIGNYYQEQKEKLYCFNEIEIMAFTDNNSLLWGQKLNDILIISPDKIQTFEYDNILIMSIYVCEIYNQLRSLGVDEKRIIIWEQFYKEQLKDTIQLFGMVKKEEVRKKVLIVTQDLKYDGGTLAAIYAAKSLNDSGISVVLMAPDGKKALIREVTKQGIIIAVCPSLPYIFEVQKKWIMQFDAVIVNLFTMVESAFEISKIRPTIWWIHEASIIYKTIMMKYVVCSQQFDMSKISIYAVSDIAKQNFNREYKNAVVNILSVGIPDVADINSDEKCRTKKLVFAIIGTVYPLKAQDIFLKAASIVGNEMKSEFWVIGRMEDNEYCRNIKDMAARIESVKVLGELTRTDIERCFRDIDVLVCVSQEETLSMTVIEAMMLGKVCITTENTGIADYIQNGVNGFVIPYNNVTALIDKMQWIIKNRYKAEKIGREARKIYEKYFTMDTFSKNFQKALNEIIERWSDS